MNRLINLLLLLGLPLGSFAHGYWLEVRGSGQVNQPVTVQLCHGEIDGSGVRRREAGDALAQLSHFTLYALTTTGEKIPLMLRPRLDCWTATFTPTGPGTYQLLGYSDELPVVDRTGKDAPSVRAVQYVCAAYCVGPGQPLTMPHQWLDILTARIGKTVTVRAFRDGRPVTAGTRLRIFNPENWEKTPIINAQGEATFVPTMKGLYIIRQDWIDPRPGTDKGVPYQSVRHRCDYSLWVD